MNRDELIERLNGHEWNDVEFKTCQRGVGDSAYETVSAFANTGGGWLIFGVRERDGNYEVVGVLEVDKVQNDFLSALRAGGKLNKIIQATSYLIEEDGKAVLAFYIPEARRQDKPICLRENLRLSYIRRGGCDERCTLAEIERFVREAADERYDGQTVDLDPEHCFDSDALRWYRRMYGDQNHGQQSDLTDIEFLHHWGLVIEKEGQLLPTKASLLLFGDTPYLLQILPRPVVDCQWINEDFSDVLPDQRWDDRILSEVNLIQTWRSLVDFYRRHAETPFSIHPDRLQRDDTPPDYISFRESVINLLIHQDYADHNRKASIKFYRDRTVIWNPGDAFVKTEELLDPREKEVRNPRIVGTFRRIGLSDQAGTGVRAIFISWRRLGHVPPVIHNNKTDKTFELDLLKQELLSEQQLLFQASLGVRLSPEEAAAFAFACHETSVHLIDVKAVTGLASPQAQAILDRLAVQALLERIESASQPYYVVVEHLRDRMHATVTSGDQEVAGERLVTDQPEQISDNLVSDQPRPILDRLVTDQPQPLQGITEIQWRIILLCDTPRSLANLMENLGVTHRTFFRRRHLDPLITGGVVRLTYPDQPHHPDQAYALTEIGAELKARRVSEERKAQETESE
ncbi:MAG TPA: RNA-binding domain-containing protein [Blastocatellia bacterium]|nr:RNA-binding domain-containing protein [Blastocatellia bacterium]